MNVELCLRAWEDIDAILACVWTAPFYEVKPDENKPFGYLRNPGFLSILLASGLGELVRHHQVSYAAMAALTGLIVGIISSLAWIFRLGFVVNFISEPVLTGTITGAALVIAASQVSKLLGIEGGKGEFFERIGYIFQHLGQINLPTLLLGLAGIALLLFADKRFRKFPNSLIVVLLSIGLMSATNLTKLGVKVVGAIPHGLPHLSLPAFTLTDVVDLLPLGFSVFLLSYVEGMSVARALAHKHRYPSTRINSCWRWALLTLLWDWG